LLWQANRCPILKTKLNQAIKALKNLLDSEKNQGIQKYLSKLSPIIAINYLLESQEIEILAGTIPA